MHLINVSLVHTLSHLVITAEMAVSTLYLIQESNSTVLFLYVVVVVVVVSVYGQYG
jgi:hypothetical protein